MTDAIQILMTEHRFIEKILGSLETFVESEDGEREAVAKYVEFFRSFADRCHHGKEEDHLFEALHRRGMPVETGPLKVMLQEHAMGREQVRELAAFAEGEGPLSKAEREQLREVALGYIALLRAHIMKEDNVLFPMAFQSLGAETLAEMSEAFERFEQAEMGEGVHERLHGMAESLIEAYPPDPERVSGAFGAA